MEYELKTRGAIHPSPEGLGFPASKDKTKKKPPSDIIYSVLSERNMIRPGTTVSGYIIESIIGKKYEGSDDWAFIGPYLALKTLLESEGYFISQKGIDAPGFRILKTSEMADHANMKLMQNLADTYKTALILATHQSREEYVHLSDEEKKKFDCVRKKASNISMMQQKMLLDNQIFLD